MDRRVFFKQAAALTTTTMAAALFEESAAHAAAAAASRTVCGFDKRRKANVCTVRVSGPFQFYSPPKGTNMVAGCWIACLQMVFKYYGYNVPSNKIRDDVYEGKVPSKPWQDLTPLAKTLVDDKGKRFGVVTEKLSVRAADAAELLAENQPLIIGAFDHPVLLTAMSYTGDRLGGMTIVDATVLDPAPGKGTRVVSSPEWINVTFITRVGVRKPSAKT